ncbi:MAG: arginase family protein [Candidatus Acidiferrales bacterium]
MAVKITRQPDKIALLGAPTSAAAMSPGHERAPAALRAAGLIDRLRSIGYEVTDHGDDPVQLSQEDSESPRARNLPRVVKSLEALRPRVEAAVKSGALPIILTGDCTSAVATVAGVRRYFHNVSMIYLDRDADVNIPATTPSGCVDGMVVAHLTGRGAAELVRFWGEPPLVRDPDIALFGVERLDPPEEDLLRRIPIRSFPASEVHRKGAAATARVAIERIHASRNEFILHLDVDVIADFQATNFPGSGGLTLDEVREALEVFVADKHLAAIDVAAYNPEKDSDGSGAKLIIELLASVLASRREAHAAPAAEAASAAASGGEVRTTAGAASAAAAVVVGHAWSSDTLDNSTPAAPEESSDAKSADDSTAAIDVRQENSGENSLEEPAASDSEKSEEQPS